MSEPLHSAACQTTLLVVVGSDTRSMSLIMHLGSLPSLAERYGGGLHETRRPGCPRLLRGTGGTVVAQERLQICTKVTK
jgi:hypothetical protein